MKLIVDGGSTKTDWGFFCEPDGLQTYQTQGINPCHQDSDRIKSIIDTELLGRMMDFDCGKVTHVHFYGAGCATPALCNGMRDILAICFPNAEITVASDMLGAARALCCHSEGIACVLGTGSNSCLYNGKDIVDQVPSLGFILGDEGSSAALGRRLIGDCLKRQLPEAVSREFLERYSLNIDTILENVYRQPMPSRFIASFAPFLSEKKNVPEIHKLLISCFSEFFTRNVINYHRPWLPVHFTGSLASNFAAELTETADSLGMTIGTISASPMEGLVAFHCN